MSSRFYFSPSDSDSDLSDTDASTLPFPKPLDRTSFLSSSFDPTDFLSSLTSRFQTLEDLQTELRDLSSTLNKELVDLVNDNYSDFLSVGSTLRGGEEKIEDIRVGVLGFQRDVGNVRGMVELRRGEVKELLEKKRSVRGEIGVGRQLLDIAERVEVLEGKLNVTKTQIGKGTTGNDSPHNSQQWSAEWVDETPMDESDDEYDDSNQSVPGIPPQLKRRAEDVLIVKLLISRHSPQHPFIQAQEARVRNVQELILSDLDAAVRREPEIKIKQQMLQLRASIAE